MSKLGNIDEFQMLISLSTSPALNNFQKDFKIKFFQNSFVTEFIVISKKSFDNNSLNDLNN
jgi:hypothetical protein